MDTKPNVCIFDCEGKELWLSVDTTMTPSLSFSEVTVDVDVADGSKGGIEGRTRRRTCAHKCGRGYHLQLVGGLPFMTAATPILPSESTTVFKILDSLGDGSTPGRTISDQLLQAERRNVRFLQRGLQMIFKTLALTANCALPTGKFAVEYLTRQTS